MRTSVRLLVLGVLGVSSFGTAYAVRSSAARALPPAVGPPRSDAPDSVKLAAMGVVPGRQLTVYVLAASRCAHCQMPETKAAIREIKGRLLLSNAKQFSSASVIGVAVDANIQEGLDYLGSIGLSSFDEISVGNAWLNEHLARLLWRERATEAAVPQAIVVARDVHATFDPFSVTYSRDSLIAVVRGRNALVQWVKRGATTKAAVELALARGVRTVPQSP